MEKGIQEGERRGIQEGERRGILEGERRGAQKEREESILHALKNGHSDALITDIFGCDRGELEQLKRKL
jgi:predicted transposase YdaD